MKLNLGCGSKSEEGYVNIDVRALPGVDVIADVRHLPFKKNTIDEILSLDVYEHVSHRESQRLLVHWVSLLKDGCLLYIRAPSINRMIQYFLAECLDNNNNDMERIESLIDNIFGGQEYEENLHRTIVQPELMYHYLRQAGIKGGIERQFSGQNIKIRAYK